MTTADAPGPRRIPWRRAALAIGLIGLIAASTWWFVGRPSPGPGRLSVALNTFYQDGEVAFSPDGRTIATPGIRSIPPFHRPFPDGLIPEYGATQGLVELRDAATGAEFASLGFDPLHGATSVHPIVFSPDGSLLVAGNWPEDGGNLSSPLLKVWEVGSGRLRTTLELPPGAGREVTFSPDGRSLLASIVAIPGDGQISLASIQTSRPRVMRWETANWKPIEGMTIPAGDVYATALEPGGALIAATHVGRTHVTLYEIPSGRERARLSPRLPSNVIASSRNLLFSPDGRTLATSGRFDNVVELWDVASATLRASIPPATGDHEVFRRMTFSPDGRTLARGASYLPPENPGARISREICGSLGVGWSPPGLVGRVTLFDVATVRRRTEIDGVQPSLAHLTFSPDGRTLVTDVRFPPPRKSGSVATAPTANTPRLDRRLIFWTLPAGL